ncbi:hypothetical protein KCU64_g8163, partial [Aureobasidium melanogenum]
MAEILVLQAQVRENFLAVQDAESIQFLAGYVPNTDTEVWTAKIGHFHGFGQNATYLEAHGETLLQAYKNLLQMTVDMVAESKSHEPET